MFQRGFELKNVIYKEKFHFLIKIWNYCKGKISNQLYFGTLLLASYCYCGDNA